MSRRAHGGLRPIALIREFYSGGRLLISLGVGAVAYVLAPVAMGWALRGTVGWIAGVASFLGLTLLAVGDASPERVRERARNLDSRTTIIVCVIVAGATASLGALGFVLHKPQAGGGLELLRVGLAGLAVMSSWLLVHTVIALHYAHSYYGDPGGGGGGERGGLAFPGGEPPDYWDFFYYSFVIGMTSQVSDVQVTSRAMRRLTTAHGVLSFFFNTGVLALAVNIIAGVL